MLKKVRYLTIFVLIFMIVGCSTQKTSNVNSKSVDAEFIKEIEKSIDLRRELTEVYDMRIGQLTIDEEVESYEELVQSEAAILYKYENKEFNDPKLKKLSNDYIKGIKEQEKALDYITRDELKFWEMWSSGLDIRSVALIQLVDEYGVKVDESIEKEFRNTSQVLKEEKEAKEKVEELLQTIEFTKQSDEYGWKEYASIVENTTNNTFDTFELEIKLIDNEGITIAHEYDSVNNWELGEKVKFSFGTDQSFEELEWTANYYVQEK